MALKGKFITFEGAEGSGKSTQITFALEYLKAKKYPVMLLREPGGVMISEKVRAILLDPENNKMGKECETLLYMAARAQLVAEIVEPALKSGKIVLCDRFLDSTIVYQGYGCGVDIKFIKTVGTFATHKIKPDLTFLFDIDVKLGFARIKRAKDRIEQRDLDYHNKVRQGYITLSKQEPKRIKLIDGTKPIDEIKESVRRHLDFLLKI